MAGVGDGSRPADQVLVAAARTGSVAAFEALVERYHAPLLGYLTRQTGDPELAADLVQETFIDAFRRLDRLTDEVGFAAWLYQIARYHLLPAQRRRWRRQMLSLDWLVAQVGTLVPALRRADDTAATHERDLIQQVLDGLSPALREALLLHKLWGFPSQEVAAILGISPAAARKRISRAEEQFRVLYRSHVGSDGADVL